jgi:multidrug efflux pump subunit AcrA (membrane-fusion protein)
LSPITKAFVVLHVILSMLLTAGVVVFVNRVDDYKKIVADERAKGEILKRAAETAAANETSAKISLTDAQTQLAAQVAAAKADKDKANAELLAKNAELADLQKNLAIVQAQNTQLAQGLNASQTAQNQLNTQLAELRTTVDDLQKKKLELDAAVADLTQQRDTLEKQRRDLAERVAAIETDYQKATAALTKAGINWGPKISPDWTSPPINGVVREVRMIEQVPYATISVGSADAVTRDMKFRVIDRKTGEFLGMLTVQSVDTNEASGRLEGPAINRITRGAEVRTQL